MKIFSVPSRWGKVGGRFARIVERAKQQRQDLEPEAGLRFYLGNLSVRPHADEMAGKLEYRIESKLHLHCRTYLKRVRRKRTWPRGCGDRVLQRNTQARTNNATIKRARRCVFAVKRTPVCCATTM